MDETILVELKRGADGLDLAETLGRRGVTGRVVRHGELWALEIRAGREPLERLLIDVLSALETWLAYSDTPAVDIRVGRRLYTFRSGAEGRRLTEAHRRASEGGPRRG